MRLALEFNPEFTKFVIEEEILEELLMNFEGNFFFYKVNNNKCTANAIKIITLCFCSKQVKITTLFRRGFLSNLYEIYSPLTDLHQGGEIIELVIATFNFLIQEIGFSEFDLEAGRKVSFFLQVC